MKSKTNYMALGIMLLLVPIVLPLIAQEDSISIKIIEARNQLLKAEIEKAEEILLKSEFKTSVDSMLKYYLLSYCYYDEDSMPKVITNLNKSKEILERLSKEKYNIITHFLYMTYNDLNGKIIQLREYEFFQMVGIFDDLLESYKINFQIFKICNHFKLAVDLKSEIVYLSQKIDKEKYPKQWEDILDFIDEIDEFLKDMPEYKEIRKD